MALHLVGSLRLAAVTLFQYFILQSAGQCDHTLFLGIVGQELLTVGLGSLALLGTLGAHLLVLLLEELLHNDLCVAVTDFQLVARNNILNGGGKIINADGLSNTHLHQLLTNAQSQCITQFVHFFNLIICNILLLRRKVNIFL